MRRPLELQRQHVEQHLGIGVGVDVAEIELEELALQRLAVGQVAVVRERDAERRVDVERLRLELRGRAARGRIAAVADADVAEEVAHVARAEHVAHVAARLVHVERRAVVGDDAGGVLAAVLQQQQPVVEHLVDRRVGDDAYDSAHVRCSPRPAEETPGRRKIEPVGPGAGQIGLQRQRGLRQRLSKGRILPPILLGQGGDARDERKRHDDDESARNTEHERRACDRRNRGRSPGSAPPALARRGRRRSARRRGSARTRAPASPPASCRATRTSSASGSGVRDRGDEADDPRGERDHFADDAAGEREERRQRDDGHDGESNQFMGDDCAWESSRAGAPRRRVTGPAR